jgi:hypothetical protein
MATGVVPPPVVLPAPSRRPGSANFADVYGAPAFGPTTAAVGGEGARREAGAALAGGAPITINGIGPDFLARPAGALVVLVGVLVALSFLDR